MKPLFLSLSAFALLGVMSVADVNTSCYYEFAHLAMHPAGGPAANEASQAGGGEATFQAITYDFIVAQLGQAKFFSEIGREMRDLTNLGRCWQRGGRVGGLDDNVTGTCTAFAGPL
jgi:hypothetical protein